MEVILKAISSKHLAIHGRKSNRTFNGLETEGVVGIKEV